MSGELTLLLAFGAGIGGALHCIGMCSGLAGGLFAGAGRVRGSEVLLYHGTRVLTYAVLGMAGAAVATMAGIAAWNVALYFFARKRLDLDPSITGLRFLNWDL